MHLRRFLAWLAVPATLPLVTFASDADTIISSLESLGNQVQRTRNALTQFDGGLLTTLPLASEIYRVIQASNAARRSFEDADPIAYDDVPDVLDQYHTVRASIEDALSGVGEKVSVIDSTGVRMMAVAILQNFAAERAAFEMASKAKIPRENHIMINGPVDSLANEIQGALSFFQ